MESKTLQSGFGHTCIRKISIFLILLPPFFILMRCGVGPLHSPAVSDRQEQLIRHASSFLGTPYRLGGSSLTGMDCSGLVVRIFKDVYGMTLPHNTLQLYRLGDEIPLRALNIGNLVFFRQEKGMNPSHVGVYLGQGRFIHASISKGVVISKLKDPYYRQRYTGARRIPYGLRELK